MHAGGRRRSERWTEECQTGWWDGFVGPGKALDTDRFFVICANYLGGCYGSTGPSSPDPESGQPYGSRFPHIAFPDIVDSQIRLLDHLGIGRLHAAVGASIGGMLCTSLATRHPDRVRIVIPIASGISVSPLQRVQNFEQIFAIETDANFNRGDYYGGAPPNQGLALARMISHKTYISLRTLERRARRELRQSTDDLSWYEVTRPHESYMLHQGGKFVKRFDANTYLRIMDAWQRFDAAADAGADDSAGLFARCKDQRYLIFSIDCDVCFYPDQQAETVRALNRAGVPNIHITVHSEKGHDSFLLEPELYTPHLVYALNGG
ncbi:MAG: homoserine O-acetyltransferase [Verrucomicrobiales bacterium]